MNVIKKIFKSIAQFFTEESMDKETAVQGTTFPTADEASKEASEYVKENSRRRVWISIKCAIKEGYSRALIDRRFWNDSIKEELINAGYTIKNAGLRLHFL